MGYKAGDRLREENFEIVEYEDTGCEISKKCVECPLPQCKHDDANWYRRYRRYAEKYVLLLDLQVPNVDYEKAAQRFKFTEATVRKLHMQVLCGEIDLELVKFMYHKLVRPPFPAHLKRRKYGVNY